MSCVCQYQYSLFSANFSHRFPCYCICTLHHVLCCTTVDWRQWLCNSDFCVCQKDDEIASAVTCHFGRFSHSFFALYKPDLVPAGWSVCYCCCLTIIAELYSVLWRCWLGSRRGMRPVKNWVVGCWRGYLSGASCRLAQGPADATATQCLLLQ